MQTTPNTIPATKETVIDPVSLKMYTDNTPARANTDPHDRSSNPAMISNVSPNAKIVVTEIWAEIFAMFRVEKKFSFSRLQTMIITITTM